MNARKLRYVICTLAILAGTALAAAVFHVHGNLEGAVVAMPISATQARLVVNLSGQLSHLGKTNTIFETVADFSGPVPVPVSSNVGVITAANGDQIFFTQRWTAVSVGGTEYAVTAVVQAAGGTGRFAGISGSGSYVARLDLGTGAAAAVVGGSLRR